MRVNTKLHFVNRADVKDIIEEFYVCDGFKYGSKYADYNPAYGIHHAGIVMTKTHTAREVETLGTTPGSTAYGTFDTKYSNAQILNTDVSTTTPSAEVTAWSISEGIISYTLTRKTSTLFPSVSVVFTFTTNAPEYIISPDDERFITYNINSSGVYTGFTINPAVDNYAIKQNLIARLSNVRGDLPYNTQLGVPLKFTMSTARLTILDVIKTTTGVVRCEVVKERIENKRYVMDVRIFTQFDSFLLTV